MYLGTFEVELSDGMLEIPAPFQMGTEEVYWVCAGDISGTHLEIYHENFFEIPQMQEVVTEHALGFGRAAVENGRIRLPQMAEPVFADESTGSSTDESTDSSTDESTDSSVVMLVGSMDHFEVYGKNHYERILQSIDAMFE